MRERIIVGLDVGTSKVSSSVCKLGKNNAVNVLGMSRVPCKGLKDGVIADLDETIDSIEKAIEEVERQSETEVYTVIVNVNGGHIRGENSRGAVIIPEKESEVTKKMMDKAIESAKMLALPLDRRFVHIIPQGYTVDGQEGIKNPLGMYATKLEVELYCIDGVVTLLQNVVKGVNMAGYEVGDLVFSPIAASYAVLSKEERELGVILIDIGAGTADMVVFIRGNIKDAVVLPGGGDKLTDNLSRKFRIPYSYTEELMRRFGCTQPSATKDKERIYQPQADGKNSILRHEFCKVIESDMREIFEEFKSKLEKYNYKEMAAAGLVITGGLSLMDGVAELAEEVFGVHVRLGLVRGFENTGNPIIGPLYATTFGLIRYGIEQDKRDIGLDTKSNSIFKRITNKVRALYEEYF